MVVEFRLLGSFELLDGTRPVPLTAHKPRALLAMLVLHAGQLVPWHQLLDELWEGEPPRSAIPNLRTYASELRRIDVPEPPAARRPSRAVTGCFLEHELVDLVEFDRLCAQARRRHIHGELPLAESAYLQAYGYDVGHHWPACAPARSWLPRPTPLQERRIGVVEDFFEVRLDLLGTGHGGRPRTRRRPTPAHRVRFRCGNARVDSSCWRSTGSATSPAPSRRTPTPARNCASRSASTRTTN